ncbi:ThuA domain-containing protein [Xylanimonas protaetiae]|uniref:ThuA domain-containing protein n=1 Tax=Xylanimonas protaetiae TaxID=2509457 RepID=A0A4P6F3Q5_9MICO|nr:ThuA domain-containing protein [Xylanimonas protaetiae]QAY69875.1 ThuA domain-containing protein [Xylanimonas protaetiae]
MSERTRVVILTGRGRHEDSWHDHAATSHELANVMAALGDVDVMVRSAFLGVLVDLDDVDLLVLNIGGPMPGYVEAAIDGAEEDWAGTYDTVEAWARAGGRILAVHQTALALPGEERFEELLGGRWVEGVSGHPEIGPMRLTLATGVHPLTAGLGAVSAFDERYCNLRVAPGSQVLGWVHDDDGEPHPALWVTEAHGGRTVYSALGHDARSYESPSHQELLACAALWLLS